MKLKSVIPHMGKLVKVEQTLERKVTWVDGASRAKWIPTKMSWPRVGWFSGVRWLQEGTVHHATGGYDDFDPGYIVVEDRVLVALVCFWPTAKPVAVPILGCLPVEPGEEPEARGRPPGRPRTRKEKS